jgi:MinD superfamily P-loop ATPase
MVSCNLLCDKYIDDNDCELAKEIKESNPFSIISLMQIKNFIVTNTPTDGCDDCAYLSMDTDAVVNVCPECAEERT